MTIAHPPRSFVAIGDSFTEGLDDPDPVHAGSFRGWADRVAEHLAGLDPEFAYANFAVRGRKLDAILDEQLPRALELAPDLVSIAGGTNDVLRPRVDLDRIAARFDEAVAKLRVNGSQVVLFQAVDPAPRSRLIGRAAVRLRALTDIVEDVAARHDCFVVRLWDAAVLADPRLWSVDRLHLSSEGHARVAAGVLDALDLGDPAELWSRPLSTPYLPPPLRVRLTSDVRWVRMHLAPWVGRRLRGVSSGDAVLAKRPDLTSYDVSAGPAGAASSEHPLGGEKPDDAPASHPPASE
jgi:lysophospholipase L1-like esterase